ncbi:MAG: GNAT family N-acetyltransferase [Tissierellia bacterium]|nr:GNAT family N-acetyltransferase [Tissierellia bacterium]
MEFKYGDKCIYYGDSPEEFKAIIDYKPVEGKENVMDCYHTEVKKELGGQGVAGKLVDELAERARKENFKVLPTCSYAKAKMEKDEKYKDVLYQE